MKNFVIELFNCCHWSLPINLVTFITTELGDHVYNRKSPTHHRKYSCLKKLNLNLIKSEDLAISK